MHKQQLTHDLEMQLLFDIQQASVARTKTPFSIVFIQFSDQFNKAFEEADYEELYTFVSTYCRNTDRVYRHPSRRFVIVILSFSGNDEAHAFFERLTKSVPQHFQQSPNLQFLATTNEIANCEATLQEIIKYNDMFLRQLPTTSSGNIAHTIDTFSQAAIETVRISILETNDVARSIIKNSMENLSITHFDLQLQTFHDGLQFINSDWHLSGHTHIVITNDILPFKNGLEIVTYLRSLPNDEKYIILLISKRSTEEAIIYAYNNGVDAYFTRPFNIRLLEAQLKNILKRLR